MGISEGPSCPLPLPHHDRIILGHGSGGKLTDELISRLFYPCFDNPALRQGNDSAALSLENGARIAVSTDAHVVSPLFFPGGDIGRLAVCGTVNDVAMSGAIPRYLTAGFILEEGLEVSLLGKVIESMRDAAAEAGVQIAAGDTKVVQRGKADGLYITTAGIGILPAGRQIGGAQARPGDVVLLSGPLGDHGIAVLAARGELGFETDIQSDAAPLNHLIAAMLAASPNVHVLRDPTRGGLGTTLNEIAGQSQVGIQIDENAIPVRPAVAAACEMLGFDPLYIANEGKLVAIVAAQDAELILEVMHRTRYGEDAVRIGEVLPAPAGRVLLRSRIGGVRLVERLSGELLPRIC
ncbi:MAG TPA: hydrogenase expression/formation protein HypE [Anaerolineales bacterium]|nr:hydrogenase expression/formation protein HypE [Anaerolineales bacterium]